MNNINTTITQESICETQIALARDAQFDSAFNDMQILKSEVIKVDIELNIFLAIHSASNGHIN